MIFMASLILNSTKKEDLKILASLAKKLGVSAKFVKDIPEVNEEKSPYNPMFVKMVLEAKKRGNYKEIDSENVWKSLGLK
jgi:hypothetical protein